MNMLDTLKGSYFSQILPEGCCSGMTLKAQGRAAEGGPDHQVGAAASATRRTRPANRATATIAGSILIRLH